MIPELIFWLALGFSWVVYVWEQYLAYRQYRKYVETEKRPEELSEIIDEENFRKSRLYKLDRAVFAFVVDFFGEIKNTLILLLGLLPFFWDVSGRTIQKWGYQHEIIQSMVFVLISFLISFIIQIPFSIFDTFVIEEKHGFNKKFLMTIYPEFIAPLFDKYTPLPEGELRTKIEALAQRLKFPLKKLYVVEGSKRSAHSNAYLYGLWNNKRIVLYDTLLEEYSPVQRIDKETTQKEDVGTEDTAAEKEEIENNKEASEEPLLEEKKEEKAGEIEQDGEISEGDQKNGEEGEKNGEEEAEEKKPKKKLGMNNDEVVAVLGHELGHWKLNHTLKNLAIGELDLLFSLACFALLYQQKDFYIAFGFPNEQPTIIGLLIIFSFIFAPYQEVLQFCMTYLTRMMEFQADKFSAELGYTSLLCSALIKMGKDNLTFPVDDWLYSFWHHSHPPIPERDHP